MCGGSHVGLGSRFHEPPEYTLIRSKDADVHASPHSSASAPHSSTFSEMRAMSVLGINGGIAAIPACGAEFSHLGGCLGHFSQEDD